MYVNIFYKKIKNKFKNFFLKLKMIKCNKCLKEFNTNLNRPEIIFPCQHIFCSECLIQANACLQCLNRIETKKLSQDVISEQTRLNKQQKLLKKYNQIKETNKSLILTSQLIKHSNESNVIKIQQEINTKANQLIAQINDQKNNLLQTVKNESNELNLKLNKIITHHVQMISDEKHPNLKDQIDLNKLDEHLKQIENKIEINLKQANNLNFNQVFVSDNNNINLGNIVKKSGVLVPIDETNNSQVK